MRKGGGGPKKKTCHPTSQAGIVKRLTRETQLIVKRCYNKTRELSNTATNLYI